nr:serine/threonine-protein kinase [Kineosporia babensis]
MFSSDPDEVVGYRILGRLGSGGQGVVFLGVDPAGERVAIKMLRVEDEDSRAQLAKEVAAARRVAPFCTAQILRFDLQAPAPFVISEFIEGQSLKEQVAERGPLSGPRLQRLAIGTVTALAAIHQAGVVHRDLKPANVMMSPEGPRVIDFGVARNLSNLTTQASKLFGTPAYMSPEQVSGERVGPATDLFSWASLMVFAATGRAPFEAEHAVASINKVANQQPDLSGVPPELLPVLRGCFSKDAADRPSAQEALGLMLGQSFGSQPPNTSAVLAAGAEFAEAMTDPGDVTRAAPIKEDAPTWARGTAAAVAEPSDDQVVAVPRPRSRKWRKAAMIGVPALLVAGIGVGVGLNASGSVNGAGSNEATVITPPSATATPSEEPTATKAAKASPTQTKGAGGAATADNDDGDGNEDGNGNDVDDGSDNGKAADTPEASKTSPSAPRTTDARPAGTLPSALAGTWQGVVTQRSSSVDDWQWMVELDLKAGKKKTGVMNTDLGCSSQLTVTKASGDTAELRAPIRPEDDPDGVCSELGIVSIELNPSSDTMDFVFQDTEDPTNVGNATLSPAS